ncbi:MAG TPA: Mov34/MPN/PAD-1 family protein [Polyangiaceae bacterium]|jgi:proteasome lid subunit RPN8/RPN11|nr:Mov34/MPN/PAD-1 family protein [Polyangiaceae bacterium]
MSWPDAPWTGGELRISREAIALVERDAIVGYEADQEACGYLAGPAADPLLCDRAEAIENLARILHERDPVSFFHPPRKFFAFHERTLEAAMRDGTERGSPVKVLYHSHLDVGAYLSGTDEAVLSRGSPPSFLGGTATLGPGPAWPLAFLVSSVRKGEAAPFVDDHRLFVWRSGRFEPSTFVLV